MDTDFNPLTHMYKTKPLMSKSSVFTNFNPLTHMYKTNMFIDIDAGKDTSIHLHTRIRPHMDSYVP